MTLKKVELGETKNIHQFGNVFLAGQFTPDDIALIKAAGVQTVITLRTDGEIDWDEASALKAAGTWADCCNGKENRWFEGDVEDVVGWNN